MLRARQFRVDPRRVVHETIDGETILIDLESGTYFSLRGSGSQIWALLTAGWSESEVVGEMEHRYPTDPAVGRASAELIMQLADAGLVVETDTELASPAEAKEEIAAPDGPYDPPVLERYTDMQYFLLLDPIHEVQEGGWPHAPRPRAEPTETG